MCNETNGGSGQADFTPKDGYQTELHEIWEQYHLNGMSAGLPIQVKAITEWKKLGNKYDYDKIVAHLKELKIYEVNLLENLPENMYITGKERSTITKDETYKYGHDWVHCSLPEDFEDTLNELCDNIEEEESNRFEDGIESWDDIKDEDGNIREEVSNLEDPKIIALAQHLDLTPTEAHEDIECDRDCNYSYSGIDYLVCTDEEADELERETVENTIEECYLSELNHSMKNHPALNYIDMDRWIDDWCNNRGENLGRYDSTEHYEDVDGITYYIYKT